MPLIKTRLIAAGISSLFFLSACNAQEANTSSAAAPRAASAEKPVAIINGKPISQSRLNVIVNERTAQGQPDSPEARAAIRDNLIATEILAQEAQRSGIDRRPEVATQMEMARQTALIRAFLQDYVKTHPITDADLKAEYDRIRAQMGDKEYKVRHILVATEAEAKDIIAQLNKGAKFEKLAAKSMDPGSKAKGGSLDWISRGNVVKPFGDALATLEKGKFTQTPVKSDFGWHVIKLEDTRAMPAPPFEQVKPNLTQRMQSQQIEKLVADLRAKAKVEGVEPPPTPAPAAGASAPAPTQAPATK